MDNTNEYLIVIIIIIIINEHFNVHTVNLINVMLNYTYKWIWGTDYSQVSQRRAEKSASWVCYGMWTAMLSSGCQLAVYSRRMEPQTRKHAHRWLFLYVGQSACRHRLISVNDQGCILRRSWPSRKVDRLRGVYRWVSQLWSQFTTWPATSEEWREPELFRSDRVGGWRFAPTYSGSVGV